MEKGTLPSQPKVNLKGGPFSSFDPNNARKANVVISLWLSKEVDTHVGEHDVNVSPPPTSSLPPS